MTVCIRSTADQPAYKDFRNMSRRTKPAILRGYLIGRQTAPILNNLLNLRGLACFGQRRSMTPAVQGGKDTKHWCVEVMVRSV